MPPPSHRAPRARLSHRTAFLTGLAASVLLAGVSAAATLDSGPARTAAPAAPVPPTAPVAAPSPSPAGPVPLPVTAAASPLGPSAPDAADPSTWSSQQLAAQLVTACVPHSRPDIATSFARAGIGGIVLMGRPQDATALAALTGALTASGPLGVAPLVASDEEGGRVQRLRDLLGPLPSAAEMSRWDDARIEATAAGYGARMRSLGYRLALAPVADLTSPGAWLTGDGRTFSADPARAASAAVAWVRGLQQAGVLSSAKHWPGHGRAGDSHTTAPDLPPLTALEGSDLVPFDAVLGAGAQMVMVGHLRSEGLTEPGTPATLSPSAYRVLRGRAGAWTVLLTDSLSMAAASSAVGLSPQQAAVRSLQAGADSAMVCTGAGEAVLAVTAALDDGSLPRLPAEASARRLLAVKHGLGLAPAPPVTGAPTGALSATVADGVVTLTGSATDPDGDGLPLVQLVVDGVATTELAQDPATRSFRAVLPVRTGGQVCVVALNTGAGRRTSLGCVTGP